MSKQIKYEGTLELSTELSLPCYVLEDGTRVLSGRGLQNALKIGETTDKKEEQKGGSILSRFFASNWFNKLIDNKFELGYFKPLNCYKGNQKINGFEATKLVDLCNILLEARGADELKTDKQLLIAAQAEILIRAFAKIGIIALVDEATGYQHDREKDELQKILRAYIAEELLPWQKRFPDEFYKEIFRLNDWDYTVKGILQRPGVIGRWTNRFVYEQLPKGVLQELKNKTPKTMDGRYKAKLHQSLTTDIGNPHLEKQLTSVITLMNISKDWRDFIRFFNKKFGQQELEFPEIEENESKQKSISFGDAISKIANAGKPNS